MTGPATRHKLLYLVSEDWYFVSHRLSLAIAAQAAGYDVSVATRVTKDGDTIRDAGLKLLPLTFERSGLGPVSEARTLARLIALYRQERPDLVHHVALKPVIYGSMAARAAGVGGVVNALMGLGFVFSSDSAKARALRPAVRSALKVALKGPNTRLIVQNRDDQTLIASQSLARANDLRLIRGSGVEPDDFPMVPSPPGPPLIVLPARLLKDKGVEEFVSAAKILKARGVDARFALVGDPDLRNPASISPATIAAWVASGSVEHWGWQPQASMPEIFGQSRVVCLPSYREGLPRALLEAAACGRAIVATDVPGCREVVRHGVNGWLVPPRDAMALASALLEAIERPELCARYGAAGRALIEQELSAGHVIAETLAVYRELHS